MRGCRNEAGLCGPATFIAACRCCCVGNHVDEGSEVRTIDQRSDARFARVGYCGYGLQLCVRGGGDLVGLTIAFQIPNLFRRLFGEGP